jgi:hypothetical protein
MSVVINEDLWTGGVGTADLAAIIAAVDGLEGMVDGVEALLTAIEADTTTLAAIDYATEAKQDTIIGHVDGIESTLNTIAGQVYTEGDVDTSITGPAMLAEEASTSTLKPVNTKQLGIQVTSSDYGLITNSVIHGLSSAGGGTFVDAKVNPSGSLEVNANQSTHDNLNANANIQVANTDVSNANPVPISDAGGSVTVDGTIAATQSGTWNINNISGTVSLPTGAATAANQTTANSSLSSILAAVDGLEGSVDGVEALLTTIDGRVDGLEASTSSIDSKTPALGQALAAASVPVVLTAAQLTTLTPPTTIGTKTDLTPSAPTSATVGVASAQAVAAAATRKGLVLINTSVNTISLAFGSAAVLNSGITLYPGGVYVMDEYTYDTGAVNAIASAASSNLSIQEYLT